MNTATCADSVTVKQSQMRKDSKLRKGLDEGSFTGDGWTGQEYKMSTLVALFLQTNICGCQPNNGCFGASCMAVYTIFCSYSQIHGCISPKIMYDTLQDQRHISKVIKLKLAIGICKEECFCSYVLYTYSMFLYSLFMLCCYLPSLIMFIGPHSLQAAG